MSVFLGTRLVIRPAKSGKTSTTGTKIDLNLKNSNIAILYPSLCCPLIYKKGEPLSIIIGADSTFDKFYRNNYSNWDAAKSALGMEVDDDRSNWNTPLAVRRYIGKFIKIKAWSEAVYTGKLDEIKQDKPYFTTDKAEKNIACKKLELNDGRLSIYTWDNKKKERDTAYHFANLREDTLLFYRQQGIEHFYQIDLWDVELSEKELYEISWISKDDSIYHNNERYLERQDHFLQKQYLEKDKYIPENCRMAFDLSGGTLTYEPKDTLPVQNYHPIWVSPSTQKRLSVGHLTDVHVSARQHAFKKSKATLIPNKSNEIGKMCNASFDVLKNLMDQYGNDPNIDLLFFTGDLIDYGRNYNPKPFVDGNKKTTGDLWDAMILDNMNQRDSKGKPLKEKDGFIKPNTSDYPRGLDHLTIYSLFIYFYNKYKKPVLLISGNHEAYTLPYGVSPRANITRSGINTATAIAADNPKKTVVLGGGLVGGGSVIASKIYQENGKDQGVHVERTRDDRKKEWEKRNNSDYEINDTRANEGIPADHNLTIPEAVLMYGPDYDRVTMGGAFAADSSRNFNNSNFDWFYNIFTPFSDFTIKFEDQCLIGLQWGDDEAFIAFADGHTGFAGSMLPRATKSINDNQKKLIEQALKLDSKCNMLFSHFTFVNYSTDTPVTAKGLLPYDYPFRDYVKYNYGTCENNRDVVFRNLIDKKLHYTFSGHSHRSGLYHIEKDRTFTDRAEVTGNVAIVSSGDSPSGKFDTNKLNGASRIIVSACGGPVAVQNRAKELANWGMDYPSGSFVKFSDTTESEMGLKIPTVPTAKPRLAVALDFADIVGGKIDKKDVKGVFSSFSADTIAGPIKAAVNTEIKLPDVKWITKVNIIAFEDSNEPSAVLELLVKKESTNSFNFEFADKNNDPQKIDKLFDKIETKTIFVEFTLDTSIQINQFTEYDITKPWCYQIGLAKNTIPVKVAKGYKYSQPAIKHQWGKGLHKIETDPRKMATYASAYSLQGWETQMLPEGNGLEIRRHPKYGEVPDHKWYSTYIKDEYNFPWRKYEENNEDKKKKI